MNMTKSKWERLAGPIFLSLRKDLGSEKLAELIAAYPDELSRPVINETLLHAAARGNDLPSLTLLLNASVPIDVLYSKRQLTPLQSAATNGCADAVRWLLEHGASPEGKSEVQWQTPLISAALNGHTDVVLALLEHGANVNAAYDLKDGAKAVRMNSLSWAVANQHHETAQILRAHGGELPVDSANEKFVSSAASMNDAILNSLERTLGKKHPLSLIEIVPSDFPIALNVFHSEQNDAGKTIVTDGLARDLIEEGFEGELRLIRSELMLRLPKEWPLEQQSMSLSKNTWPFMWLRKMARWSHETLTLFGIVKVISQKEMPELIAPSTNFYGALIIRNDAEVEPFILPDTSAVHFYDVLPLFQEEVELAQQEGINALIERLDRNNISATIDPQRINVATN